MPLTSGGIWNEDAKSVRILCSMSAFESTDILSFRCSLKKRLRTAFLNFSKCIQPTKNNINDELKVFLDEALPWRQLCNARDSLELGFLDEICDIITNPHIIPPAYSISLFLCLLRALLCHQAPLDDGTSKLCCPTALRLLDCMEAICKRLPSFSFSDEIRNFLREILTNITEKECKNAKKRKLEARRLDLFVSVFSKMAIRMHSIWWNCLCIKLFMDIIQSLDNFDLVCLKQDSKSKDIGDRDICLTCEKFIFPLYHKPTNHGVSMVHMLDEEEEEAFRHFKPKVQDVDEHCYCTYKERQSLFQASNFTNLPSFLIILRRQTYVQCVELIRLSLSISNQKSHLLNLRTNWNNSKNLTKVILNEIFMSPDSPSLRLCLFILAEIITDIDHVLQQLWKEVDDNSFYAEIALRVWSELIVESRQFDEPSVCWRVMVPLLTRILGYCEDDGKPENTNIGLKQDVKPKLLWLLRSLVYVLSRRRPSLYIESVQPAFKNFVARVSVAFGESRYWQIDYHDPIMLETLVNVGLLGWDMTDTTLEYKQSNSNSSAWPFNKKRGLCGACQRMGPQVNLSLSNPCNVNALSRKLQEEKKTRNLLTLPFLIESTSILMHLYDDLLCYCFSYLNYAELTKVSLVHPLFKTLSKDNSHWKRAYYAHFGPVLGDEKDFQTALQNAANSWKILFIENYRMEKTLKFQYTATEGNLFKHCICGYIGCHQMLRNKARQTKHYEVHERRIRERQSRMKQAQIRKVKRKKTTSKSEEKLKCRKKIKKAVVQNNKRKKKCLGENFRIEVKERTVEES